MVEAIKKPSLLSRFLKDTSGAFSLMWAVSMTGIIITVGATYDLAQISKAKAIAQYTADSMALTASIAVDTDNDDKFTGGDTYTYAQIGGGVDDFTGTITGSVEYDVDDTIEQNLPDGDKARLLARATVNGVYTPAFMSIVPGITTINFTATSDVAYAASNGSPVSIFFVVDNSGSMGDYDTSGTQKLASLKTSMNSFMDTLDGIDNQDDDIVRTAQYPYSQDYSGWYNNIDDDGVIPSHVVSPKWGTLTNGNITQMQTKYGTDSSGALEDAANAFPLEGAIHDAENGVSDPLKFLVFMTDGANNTSYECGTQWVDEYWVDTYPGENNRIYTSEQWWFDGWVEYHGEGGNVSVCGWDYWFDIRSLESCTEMKDAGVKIYAIAYDVDSLQKAHAEDFMQQCSSGDDYFKSAEDATALEAVFTEIGTSIVTEVIRVKR